MAKTAALRIRIEPELHKRFIDTCKAQDIPASQVLREFMKQYVSTHETTSQLDFFQQPGETHALD
jgi:antitoxin component of RelBE/YafQ-DinJ toxin-antitoxin module